MGELGEEHRRGVAHHAEGSGHGVHACPGGVALDQSERNEVENLLEDDPIGSGWCCFFIPPYRVAGISIQHQPAFPINNYAFLWDGCGNLKKKKGHFLAWATNPR